MVLIHTKFVQQIFVAHFGSDFLQNPHRHGIGGVCYGVGNRHLSKITMVYVAWPRLPVQKHRSAILKNRIGGNQAHFQSRCINSQRLDGGAGLPHSTGRHIVAPGIGAGLLPHFSCQSNDIALRINNHNGGLKRLP